MLEGYLAYVDGKCLLQFLDTAEKYSQLNSIVDKIDESEELISSEDIQMEAEENAFQEEQIKSIYVSLTS